MINIKVPATSANLGPGFDCLGMALNIYNEVNFEETGSGKIEVMWDPSNSITIPCDKNLVHTAFSRTLDLLGFTPRGVTINMQRQAIPIGRGLGSSAACVVAGVLGANEIAGGLLSFEEIVDLATEIEGHPDNVVPALSGGMTIAIQHGGSVSYSKVEVPGNLRFVALVPEFTLATSDARQALPDMYSRADAIFNLSRVAMLVACLQNNELHNLRIATEDRIHQPYRMGFIPGACKIFDELKHAGSLAEYISGAGPTIMAVVDGDMQAKSLLEKIGSSYAGVDWHSETASRIRPLSLGLGTSNSLHRKWKPLLLEPDLSGAVVTLLS